MGLTNLESDLFRAPLLFVLYFVILIVILISIDAQLFCCFCWVIWWDRKCMEAFKVEITYLNTEVCNLFLSQEQSKPILRDQIPSPVGKAPEWVMSIWAKLPNLLISLLVIILKISKWSVEIQIQILSLKWHVLFWEIVYIGPFYLES
jgi:hypothetical protein